MTKRPIIQNGALVETNPTTKRPIIQNGILIETNPMNKLHKNSITETMLTPLKEKKTKAISKSYTLKSFAENIKKFRYFEWITEEEFVSLRELHLKAIKKYIEKDHGRELQQINQIHTK